MSNPTPTYAEEVRLSLRREASELAVKIIISAETSYTMKDFEVIAEQIFTWLQGANDADFR